MEKSKIVDLSEKRKPILINGYSAQVIMGGVLSHLIMLHAKSFPDEDWPEWKKFYKEKMELPAEEVDMIIDHLSYMTRKVISETENGKSEQER